MEQQDNVVDTAENAAQDSAAKPIGGDLILPVLGLVFTLYYFSTIWDLTWEAKTNGFLMGSILLVLVAVMFVRSAIQIARGEATLGLGPLLRPIPLQVKRLALLLLSIAFIAVIEWLGFSLSVFGFLLGSLYLLGVRRPAVLWGIPALLTAGGYLLFIRLLDSRFPHGPVEQLLAQVF